MTDVLAIGDVSAAVIEALSDRGLAVRSIALEDAAKADRLKRVAAESADLGFVVVEVPGTPKDQDGLRKLLPTFASAGCRVGLTSAAGLTLSALQFHLAVAARGPLLLNTGESADSAAIARFVGGDDPEITDDAGTVELGFNCTVTSDIAEYHRQRAIAAAADDQMREFFQNLCEAIRAMAKPGLPRQLPWNPTGALTESPRLGPAPSLLDVFRLHSTDQARALLNPGQGEWLPPTLLLLGETGTGKTMIARMATDLIASELGLSGVVRSRQESLPYVSINCPQLDHRNLQHVLHGTAAAQFTDIGQPVVGLLAKAAYGVVFLDEIGDLPEEVQAMLLTYLQDGMITPTSIPEFPGFSRVIAATNRNLDEEIESGSFRNDLFQRFKHVITIPPLRERSEAERRRLIHYAAINPENNPERMVKRITADALDDLAGRSYANGNYRELESVVHKAVRAAIRRNSECVRKSDLPQPTDHLFIAERDRQFINVVAAPEASQGKVEVSSRGELRRLAANLGHLVLRTSDGAEHVVSNGTVYWSSPQSDESSNPRVAVPQSDGLEPRLWLPDAWGRVLIADDDGVRFGDPMLTYATMRPIASNLAGNILVAADGDGTVRAFPPGAFGEDWSLSIASGSECLCLGAGNDLVTRTAGRLTKYRYDQVRGDWTGGPDTSTYSGIHAAEVARAFLVPGPSSVEELAVVFRDGSVNDVAHETLRPIGSPDRIRDLDMIMQKDGIWVAVVLQDVPSSRAIKVFRLGESPVDATDFGHPSLYDNDEIRQVNWARGTSVDPLLVAFLGAQKATHLDRRMRSDVASWKDRA